MSGSGSGAGTSSEKPTNAMSDQQTMAQVVDPAIEIVRAVQLEDVTGGFSYGSCNDQGDAPFQGRVEVAFKMPTTGNPNDVFGRIQDAMIKQGWNAGTPPGQKVHGAGLSRNGVTATLGPRAADPGYGSVQLYGECRNMGEHGSDDAVNITDQLR